MAGLTFPALGPVAWFWWASLIVPAVYAGLCLGYFLFHRFFILHPSRKITAIPSDLGMDYEACAFRTPDRVLLQAWYLFGKTAGKPGTPRSVILFFPGNEGTLSKFLPQIKHLVQAGFDVLLFGYRGFGKSGGFWPTEAGLRRDALGAWDHLTQTRGIHPERIVFYAQSLGCSIAAWAAAERRPAALVLEGGFPSVVDIVSRAVPWLPVCWLTTERFDALKPLGRVACPVLVAHSRDDRAVPWALSETMLGAVRSPKAFLELRGGHAQGLTVMPEAFVQGIRDFLAAHADRTG